MLKEHPRDIADYLDMFESGTRKVDIALAVTARHCKEREASCHFLLIARMDVEGITDINSNGHRRVRFAQGLGLSLAQIGPCCIAFEIRQLHKEKRELTKPPA